MRAEVVAIGDPRPDGLVGVSGPEELVLVQQFVTHAPGDSIDVTVLYELSRSDVVPLNAGPSSPGQDGNRREFCSVEGNDYPWLAAPCDDAHQFPRHLDA